jgi:hypothetical protein
MPKRKRSHAALQDFQQRRTITAMMALREGYKKASKISGLSFSVIEYWIQKITDSSFHPGVHGGTRYC